MILFTIFIVALAIPPVLLFLNYKSNGRILRYWPRPRFDISKIPSQQGRVAIITGANVGLGRETAIQLAKKGAKVVLACRSSAQSVVDEIKQFGGDAIAMKLDLSDSQSIYEFANEYRKLGLPIHMLILNAGVMMLPAFTPTKDGFESQIGVNWLGHFYLQQLLQDIVEESAPSRVVIVSSDGHALFVKTAPPAGLTMHDTPANRASYSLTTNYGISKLLNILHAQELHEQMKALGKKVEVLTLHPGAVDTELARHAVDALKPYVGDVAANNILNFFKKNWFLDVHSGALTQLWAATSPEITEKNLSGRFAMPIAKLASTSEVAKDKNLQKRVWAEGIELISKFPRQ